MRGAVRPCGPAGRTGPPPLILALVVVLASACGGQGGGEVQAPPTDEVVALPTERIPGLPPCTQPTPPAISVEGVPEAVLPDGAVITDLRETGPLTQLTGFVHATPVAVRLELEGRAGLTVVQSEDEGLESEMLLDAEDKRVFVKARAMCDEASILAIVMAPLDEAGAVPQPSGATAQP